MHRTHFPDSQHHDSFPLLTAALAGLVSASLVSCGSKVEEKIVTAAAPAPEISSSQTDTSITLASFSELCKTRGGLVQTHASCSGNNSCKGVSFHSESSRLIEHSCKAVNTCAGFSCVDLPADSGFTAQGLLEGSQGAEVQCTFCHGEGKTEFVLPVRPGTGDTAEKKAALAAAFQAKPAASLVNAIAFGLHGINEDGSAYANMPAFYPTYSRAEIERLVAHLRSLPVQIKEWNGEMVTP